jgi:hypothetical protein
VSDIDTEVVDSLKVLDPRRPIREADIANLPRYVRFVPKAAVSNRSKALFDNLVGERDRIEAEGWSRLR